MDTWRQPWGDALDALKYAAKATERQPTAAEKLEEERDRLRHEVSRLRYENENLRLEVRELRAQADQARRARTATVAAIPKAMWRKLVALCHPDRHPGSETAPEVTRWLLENRS